MVDDDLDKRASGIEEAIVGTDTAETSEPQEPQETEETEETEGTLVAETHDLHMYLPESRYQDLMTLYKVLDGEYYRAHGEDMEKNREYFDAVIATAMEHKDEVRERVLGE